MCLCSLGDWQTVVMSHWKDEKRPRGLSDGMSKVNFCHAQLAFLK